MQSKYAPLIFLLLTLICQFIGIMFTGGLAQFGVPMLFLFMIHSIISGYLSFFFRMSKPWIFINFMIPAGILVSVAFPGYGWIWLALMVTYGMLFLPTFWTRVPYYPSSQKVYKIIEAQLPDNKNFRFIDIGCGNAKLLAYLAKRFPAASFEGLDLSPSAVVAAKLNCLRCKNVKISLGDYWKKSFADYDYIYAFLSPTPMPEIQGKAQEEMRPGSCLLVNSFALPDTKAAETFNIGESNQNILYKYLY